MVFFIHLDCFGERSCEHTMCASTGIELNPTLCIKRKPPVKKLLFFISFCRRNYTVLMNTWLAKKLSDCYRTFTPPLT